jgi:hypothetical protein
MCIFTILFIAASSKDFQVVHGTVTEAAGIEPSPKGLYFAVRQLVFMNAYIQHAIHTHNFMQSMFNYLLAIMLV